MPKNSLRWKFLLSLGLLTYAFPLSLFSQKYYSKAELIADLDYLYKNIREVHPNMYSAISKNKFEANLAAIKANLPDSLTSWDFFMVAEPLVSSMNDGHTAVWPSLREFLDSDPYFIPIPLKIGMDDHALRVVEQKEKFLPEGAVILRINGVDASDIVKRMISFLSGETVEYRINKNNTSFIQFFFSFIMNCETYEVEYIVDRSVETKMIPGYKMTDLKKVMELEAFKKHPPYSFSEIRPGTVLFDFRECNVTDGYYKRFLDSLFTYVKNNNIQNLIIDIRENQGGNSNVVDEIFRYISPGPYKHFEKIYYRVSDQTRNYNPFYANHKKNGIFRLKSTETPIYNHSLKFTGTTYLLTSRTTFSSATLFAGCFDYYKMGTIIGEETGGQVYCFGDLYISKLPYTGLTYAVSIKEFFQPGTTRKSRHGVIPDIEIPANEALDRALKIISLREQEIAGETHKK